MNLLSLIKQVILKPRILETRGIFIPQVYTEKGWLGIRENSIFWAATIFDTCRICGVKTYDEANEILQDYLESQIHEKNYNKQKIHKMKTEPKVWRILKSKKNV